MYGCRSNRLPTEKKTKTKHVVVFVVVRPTVGFLEGADLVFISSNSSLDPQNAWENFFKRSLGLSFVTCVNETVLETLTV